MDITTGESETLTDWLPVNGELAVHEGKVYYTAPGGTWAVPNELAPPRLIGKFRASGHELVVQGRFLYEASEGGIVKLPLTLAGRYIAALGG